VDEQIAPDGAFPTVAFPNPEEPGAMDLAYATARAAGSELIIASDPDADRLAVAIPDPSAEAGYRRLSGNEVGILLGARAADRVLAAGEEGVLACSLVSTPALATIAHQAHLSFTETLTGFKWISRTPGLIFGFEEALGYLVNPDTVRDKDGLSAAIDFLALALELKAEGRTVADRLRELDERIGAFASSQVSVRVDDVTDVPRIMARIRTALPDELGGHPVESIDDFIDGFAPFPPNDILRLWLVGGARVIIRPSGTEPKLKVYIDASSTDGDAGQRRAAAEALVGELTAGVRVLLAG
jgi:phosphomannomutase